MCLFAKFTLENHKGRGWHAYKHLYSHHCTLCLQSGGEWILLPWWRLCAEVIGGDCRHGPQILKTKPGSHSPTEPEGEPTYKPVILYLEYWVILYYIWRERGFQCACFGCVSVFNFIYIFFFYIYMKKKKCNYVPGGSLRQLVCADPWGFILQAQIDLCNLMLGSCHSCAPSTARLQRHVMGM